MEECPEADLKDSYVFHHPSFSFWRLGVAPYHLAEVGIFGRNGLDVRTRLVLLRALDARAFTREDSKQVFMTHLPPNFGNKFLFFSGPLTVLIGMGFIVWANPSTRDGVLRIHRLFNGPGDYALLSLQWIAFYLVTSLVGTGLTLAVAGVAYVKRVAQFM